MKVNILIHAADGLGKDRKRLSPGDIIEMPDNKAKAWIEEGYCIEIQEPKPKTKPKNRRDNTNDQIKIEELKEEGD